MPRDPAVVDVVAPRYYHGRMGVVKRSISLDADVAETIDRVAAAEGSTFSAVLCAAAEYQIRIRAGLLLVAEWEAENGAITPAELDEARRVLYSPE